MDYGHWNIQEVGEFDPKEWFGFVYIIVNITNNKKYIGKKQFLFKKSIRLTKRKNRKILYYESDWKKYCSSSKNINSDIKILSESSFIFKILKLCKTKKELTYSEIEEQFKRNVLQSKFDNGEREYYNDNIMSRFFALDKHSEETKEKISKLTQGENNPMFGKIQSEETKEKIRKKSIGRLHTEEAKKKISEFNKNKIISEETKKLMSISAKNSWIDNEKRKNIVIENNKKVKTGSKHSEETKEKIRQSLLGKKRGPYKKRLTNEDKNVIIANSLNYLKENNVNEMGLSLS